MKKPISLLSALAFGLIFLSLNACRESFLPGFADVEIKNAAPVLISPIDELLLIPGFGVYALDLTNHVSDPENDPLTVSASNGNDDVVTLEVDGVFLIFTEVGEGTSTVDVVVTDGNDGNALEFAFDVIVSLPNYQFIMTFDLPDDTDMNELYHEGVTYYVGGGDGASCIVKDGVMEWTVPEWCGFSLEFDEPLDLSANSQFRFDYADMFGEEIWFGFEDAEGTGVWDIYFADEFGGSFVLNSPGWNTFEEFYMGDFADWEDPPVDMSQISFIYFEMAGAEVDPPSVWRVDNLFIGNLDE